MPEEGDQIRSIAGYILKNNARLIFQASPQSAAYVKACALKAFTDPSMMLRNAAQQVLIALLGALEPRTWPEALELLIRALDSDDPIVQEVCCHCPHRPLRVLTFLLHTERLRCPLQSLRRLSPQVRCRNPREQAPRLPHP